MPGSSKPTTAAPGMGNYHFAAANGRFTPPQSSVLYCMPVSVQTVLHLRDGPPEGFSVLNRDPLSLCFADVCGDTSSGIGTGGPPGGGGGVAAMVSNGANSPPRILHFAFPAPTNTCRSHKRHGTGHWVVLPSQPLWNKRPPAPRHPGYG